MYRPKVFTIQRSQELRETIEKIINIGNISEANIWQVLSESQQSLNFKHDNLLNPERIKKLVKELIC